MAGRRFLVAAGMAVLAVLPVGARAQAPAAQLEADDPLVKSGLVTVEVHSMMTIDLSAVHAVFPPRR